MDWEKKLAPYIVSILGFMCVGKIGFEIGYIFLTKGLVKVNSKELVWVRGCRVQTRLVERTLKVDH